MQKYDLWSKEELIREITALKKQKTYGLVWEKDKTKESFDLFINWDSEKSKEEFGSATNKFPVLAEISAKEIRTAKEKPVNLLIEGDNYHSLAVLNFTHKGAVDVIYIDPPYNTGNNDFKYNDQFVDKEDGYRHSKWLSFMSKRLLLAKNLLKETGVIFISIDDNELAQLKILCDEVFGENNFAGIIIVQSNPRGSQASAHLAEVHEYILVYAKKIGQLRISGFAKDEEATAEYSHVDKNGKKYRLLGLRQRGGEWRREQRPNMFYPFYVNPENGTVSLIKTKEHKTEALPRRPSGEDGRWTWAPKNAQENIHLLIGKKVNRKGEPDFYDIFRVNYYEDEEGNETLAKPKTIWLDKELNYQNGRTELKEIFEGSDLFDYPKPVYLIKKLIEMTGNKEATILDFFAGTGTTGHAVSELNNEDGGNRQFILCTNNENNICTDICYPRVKKIIEGYKTQSGEKIAGLGGNLKYFKTDFVEAEPTDKNKRKLVDKCTEMLCIKESKFEEVKEGSRFRIFKSEEGYLGIIFDDESVSDFVKVAQKIEGKFNVYVFSHDESVPTGEFKSMKNRLSLCPIPEAILKVYRKVFAHD